MTDEKAKELAGAMTPHVRALVDGVVLEARKAGISERRALESAIHTLKMTALFIDLKAYDPASGRAQLRF